MSGVQMWAATHGLYQFFTSLTENDKEHVFEYPAKVSGRSTFNS